MPETNEPLFDPRSAEWTRRRFLGAAGVGAAGTGLLLAGCGGGDGDNTTTSEDPNDGLEPQSGGSLTFGIASASAADTVDGQAAFGTSDWARSYALYNGLARINQEGQVQLWMAESIEPTKPDGTEWEIKIPSGIETHKGKPFTSKDVLYSLKRIIANKTFGSFALLPSRIDLDNSTAPDPTTVVVKYKEPFSQLKQALAVVWNVMVPEGFDPKDPDGTGPFVYKSFTPGESSVFTKNPNYWESGKPYLDELVITIFAEETAQVNALQSGQVGVISSLSAASIETLRSSGAKVYEGSDTGASSVIAMRVDTPPFDDVNVRQAMRLVIDRESMLRQVFGEFGAVGNDIFNPVDPLYDTSIPQREQDIEQAKSLLSQAGQDGLTVDLTTTPPAASGAISTAEAFATQAQAAGITINVVNQPDTQFYAKSYGTVPFLQDFWMTIPYLVEAGMAIGPEPAFNITYQDDPEWNKIYYEALATTDEETQKDLAHQLQQIDYDRGGNIIPMFMPDLSASSDKVHGIATSVAYTGPNALYWPDVWIEQ